MAVNQLIKIDTVDVAVSIVVVQYGGPENVGLKNDKPCAEYGEGRPIYPMP
jgi:hypothetical protein